MSTRSYTNVRDRKSYSIRRSSSLGHSQLLLPRFCHVGLSSRLRCRKQDYSARNTGAEVKETGKPCSVGNNTKRFALRISAISVEPTSATVTSCQSACHAVALSVIRLTRNWLTLVVHVLCVEVNSLSKPRCDTRILHNPQSEINPTSPDELRNCLQSSYFGQIVSLDGEECGRVLVK